MLEREDDDELWRDGGYYYTGVCEGAIMAGADIVTGLLGDENPAEEVKTKIIEKLPSDFVAEVRRLCRKYAGLSGDRKINAILQESEYLLDLTAYMDAMRNNS